MGERLRKALSVKYHRLLFLTGLSILRRLPKDYRDWNLLQTNLANISKQFGHGAGILYALRYGLTLNHRKVV
jgi:hypothetical protein